MKKLYFTFSLFIFCLLAYGQNPSENAILVGAWDDDALPTHFYGTFNDVWGYAENGREYAIMGSASFVHIIDVTDPSSLVEVERIPGGESTVWRDFKTYGHHAYAVSDGTSEGLMIIDLRTLPDSASVVYQSTEHLINAHNIFIDQVTGRLYTSNQPMQILDLTADPTQPTMLGAVNLAGDTGSFGAQHDLYVDNNIAYISGGNPGLFIYDFTDPNAPLLLASKVTGNYNHSNWPTEDGNTLIVAEEVPVGLELITLDITNFRDGEIDEITRFSDPLIESTIDNSTPTPHNPFIVGDIAYVSYYEDGVVAFNISDPANPFRVSYFDTHPENVDVYEGYAGCWGVYPFLPSGNIIASDFDHGLQILQMDVSGVVSTEDFTNVETLNIFPNPAQDFVSIRLTLSERSDVQISLTDVSGKIVYQDNFEAVDSRNFEIEMSGIAAGMYFLNVNDGASGLTKKIIKK